MLVVGLHPVWQDIESKIIPVLIPEMTKGNDVFPGKQSRFRRPKDSQVKVQILSARLITLKRLYKRQYSACKPPVSR
jgi:hypothetical protein